MEVIYTFWNTGVATVAVFIYTIVVRRNGLPDVCSSSGDSPCVVCDAVSKQ